MTMLDYFEQYIIGPKRQSIRGDDTTKDRYGDFVRNKNNDAQTRTARVAFKTADQGDASLLRLLLHGKTARSFDALRTVGGTAHDTFEAAARALRIVAGNEEYRICIQEATIFQTAIKLRALFVPLVLHGGPAVELWNALKLITKKI